MILELSDVKVEKFKKPTQWSNEAQEHVEYDCKANFIEGLKTTNHKASNTEYREFIKLMSLIKYESDSLEDTDFFHNNYMEYLEKCWGSHLGVVITPDIIWYTILSELATLVKSSQETYRHLFTDSFEKKKIIIVSSGMYNKSLELFDELKKNVPSDTSLYFPGFKYTKNSTQAFYAAFCDICSPYYDYCMLLCGIPKFDIKGTIDDWKKLRNHWISMEKVVQGNDEWKKNVYEVLDGIVSGFSDKLWWKSMFSLKKCGSGHQTEVSGWFSKLFHTLPRVPYSQNFSTHLSVIKYKQIDTNKDYETCMGLFNSVQENEFMVPIFSFINYDTTELIMQLEINKMTSPIQDC